MEMPKFSGIMREQKNQIMGMENIGMIQEEFGGGQQPQLPENFESLPPEVQQQILQEQGGSGAPMDLDPNIYPLAHKERSRPPRGQDPFSGSQFSNVNMPDVPVSFGGSMAEQLLNDNEVPEEIKKRFWYVFHKDNTLSFLDDQRKASKLLNFDITKIDILNAMPYYSYTFERELEFGVLRGVFETKLDRALGVKGGNVKNERIMLQSSFSEQRHINEDGGQNNMKEGFFKRLLGRR